MLQTIHDRLKGIFAVTILGALAVVFIFWGVDVSVGTFTKARGIEVNGREVDVQEVLRTYQEALSRYQAALGEAGVPEDLRKELQQNVLERAVQTELLRQRTKKLRFATSDAQVIAAIQQIPAFQVAGQFSADAYHAALRSANLTPAQFEAEQREFIVARQLDRGVSASAFVLPAEFERAVTLRQETREIGWAVVPGTAFTGSVNPDDAAIAAYYEAHQDRYLTEERADVAWVEIGIDELAAGVQVDEAELRQYYEENRARYTNAGRRRARHILIEAGADPAAAEAKAKAAYERAAAGEDFARLARELSDDPGSKDAGGDLGMAERGDFVAEFADAVWGMKPGEIRGPVRSPFGWHVIRLEEVADESARPFEEVRAELEQELRRAEVEKAFGDRQEELDTLAFEASGDLEAVASKMGLQIRRAQGFTRAGGGLLGSQPAVINAVFSAETLAGRELRTVEIAPGRVVALGVTAHQPAVPRPLEEIRPLVAGAVRLEQAQKLAAERAAAVAKELESGAAWGEATRAWQGAGGGLALARRNDAQVPSEVAAAAFRAPVPQGKPSYGTATLASGDTAVWRVTAVRPGNFAMLSPEEREQEARSARERAELADAAAYVTSMRANAEVDVNPQLFE
jgi:peptidyl-prolyl cis-trans isomerase D